MEFKIKTEEDPETFKKTKKLQVSGYEGLTIYDRIDFLNMLNEWSTKELELSKEISKKKISTKRRLTY